ncbi:hypothetical protein CPB84DRAFT_1782932 [Gymnopilus junonius]|uniref:Uncharacterized protein n=1 Tax=Gymnopilus junonius TaxID=109634 RepID=A0A9P5TKR0_GYMJU|nr:hypothetical protein CPB84DRAFT_1782932 [Gymnopilus junonius]
MQPLKIFRNTQVALDLAQCSADIDHYLLRAFMHNMKKALQEFADSLAPFPEGVVKIIDPTGKEYGIPFDLCQSYEQFDKALLSLFNGEAKRIKLLQYFIERGLIDLHFENESQLEYSPRDLENSWGSMQAGITVCMTFVLQGCLGPSGQFKCPKCCSCILNVGDNLSVNCPYCEINFRICTAENFYPYNWRRSVGEDNAIFKNTDNAFTTDRPIEMNDLINIRNFQLVIFTRETMDRLSEEDTTPSSNCGACAPVAHGISHFHAHNGCMKIQELNGC